MLAGDLISDDVPPLKSTDRGELAMSFMDEFKVHHLPVLEGNEYIGLISDTDIMDYNLGDEPISKYKFSLTRPVIMPHQHVYDVMKLVSQMNLTLVPVINEEQKYIGCITIARLIQHFSGAAAIQEPGGIIVLEMNMPDYSMTHISQCVEGNDAKILSSYISQSKESTKIEVTLKINREDISAILQTFARFNYTVKASFQHTDYGSDLKRRFDELMNYLNI